MKRIISMMCGLLFSTLLIAQQSNVYEIVEEMPEFSGGVAKMNEYLGNNIIYPEYAVDNNIEGRVIVEFIVNTDGTLSNVQIRRSVHETLDNEAIRVVKSMPKWKPGKQGGKAVRVKYVIPITFNLDIIPTFQSDEQRIEFFLHSNLDATTKFEITEIEPTESFRFPSVRYKYQTPEIYEDKVNENKEIFDYIQSLSNSTKIAYYIPAVISFKDENEDAWSPVWYLVLMDENKNIIEMVSYYP